MRSAILIVLSALTGFGVAAPAAAKVEVVSERGFVVRLSAEVEADAPAAWQTLVSPKDWWSAEHSFSGDAANFTLDARPGGCFCEALPASDGGVGPARGGVEHMRVIYTEQPRALRMTGALGPLQSEALTGTLTVQLKPIDGGGTRIIWEYIVGGFMRPKPEDVAPSVDKVLAEQLGRLAARLGPKPATGADAASPPPSAAPKRRKPEIIGR